MGIQPPSLRRRVVATAFALAAGLAAAGGATAGTAAAATRGPRPDIGVVHQVSRAEQSATRAFWTPARMAAATPAPGAPAPAHMSGTPAATSPGIPHPTRFDGVPTVGALFFTTGTQAHFCTASVVNSFTANLILTAAHCVYGTTYVSNIEFVPKYHEGRLPYGAWPVQAITVAKGWQQSQDQNLDFAFLAVAPPAGTHVPIQLMTGGLWLGINRGYAHPIEVIGYNDTGDAPIKCATDSFRFEPNQMKFFCLDFQNGTSGGPWILGFNHSTGTGTVFGVIGGYQQGGNYPWASYSAYFGLPALGLFLQAEKQA
jgi:V8-like Glu-specific endopeptidase